MSRFNSDRVENHVVNFGLQGLTYLSEALLGKFTLLQP